ncbi:MAG: hypothetical protein U9P44_03255, partial [archaeon]|nr:hypothetical protein [archaeon]
MARIKPRVKKKQKTWYSIISPGVFGSKQLAETPSADGKNLVGRSINITLSDLTGNFKHFHTTVNLRIKEIKDNKAYTEYHGQSLITDKISRMVHRWKSRIDSVDDIVTDDKHTFRIKTITITKKRMNTTVKSDARKVISDEINKYCKDKNLETIVDDIF